MKSFVENKPRLNRIWPETSENFTPNASIKKTLSNLSSWLSVAYCCFILQFFNQRWSQSGCHYVSTATAGCCLPAVINKIKIYHTTVIITTHINVETGTVYQQ